MTHLPGPIAPPPRLLMGPGPISAYPSVLTAMSAPLVGQYDPFMTATMSETQELYRQVWRTRNEATVLVDGSPLAAVLIGVSSPIDPGEHKVEAGAEGFRAEPQTVKLAEGERKSITLKLIADPNAKALVPSAVPATALPFATRAAARRTLSCSSWPTASPTCWSACTD